MSIDGWDAEVAGRVCIGAVGDDDLGWPRRRGGRCDGR